MLTVFSCVSPKIEQCENTNHTVVHFSIDDCALIFKNLTNENYQSIFEEPVLGKLKQLHDDYGLKVCLYVFYDFGGFCMKNCTDKFSDQFRQNSDWLKLAPHAFNSDCLQTDSVNYDYMRDNLRRISSDENLTKTVRLEKFQGCFEDLTSTINLQSLLTADDVNRPSYYIGVNAEIAKNEYLNDSVNNKYFYKTDFRLDNPDDFENFLADNKCEDCLVVFTHEWLLNVPFGLNIINYANRKYKSYKIWRNLECLCMYLCANHYEFLTDFEGKNYGR